MKRISTRQMGAREVSVACALILGLVVVGCSSDDGPANPGGENNNSEACPIVPDSWEGIWDYSMVTLDCETQEVLGELDVPVRFCAGKLFVLGVDSDEFDFKCTGTVTDEMLHMETTVTFEEGEDCIITSISIVDATLSGDTMTGTASYSTTYSSGCSQSGSCSEEEFTAVRRSGESGCDTGPSGLQYWGAARGIYR